MIPETLITADELALRLKVDVDTIYRNRDELPHRRFPPRTGRYLFDWEEVLDYLREGSDEHDG